MKKKSVTLMEVLIAALILSLVFAGLLATFVSARRYVRRSNRRLVAANLVRKVLNDLYREVRHDTWDTSSAGLSIGQHPGIISVTIDNQDYSGKYRVINTGHSYRKVNMHLNYPGNKL